MKLISLDDIIIPSDRQRSEFKRSAIDELAESISSPIGLLQPIVLQNDSRTLVGGERRIRAIRSLRFSYFHDGKEVLPTHVPYVLLSELSPDLILEAELHENLRRIQLSWRDEARALARLHFLRQKNSETQTFTQTAAEVLGPSSRGELESKISQVSSAVLLFDHLDDPFISAAKDANEAKKILRERLRDEDRRSRLASVDFSSISHKLFLGDCFKSKIPQNFFSVIITDPPYGIDIHTKDTFDSDRHEYDDSKEAFDRICQEFPSLAFSSACEAAHLYCFCDIRRFEELLIAFAVSGWIVWPRPIIWNKGNTGSFGNISYGFRSCYDAILFARKGDRKMSVISTDVISINQSTGLPHPAGKPVALYQELPRRSAFPNENVADFFCGHGPIFPAAMALGLTAYGWELNPKYHSMALESLNSCRPKPEIKVISEAPKEPISKERIF